MNERLVVHAIWAGAAMYCVAVVCLSVVVMQRAPSTGELVGAKLLALFGPIITLLSAALFRGRNGGPKP